MLPSAGETAATIVISVFCGEPLGVFITVSGTVEVLEFDLRIDKRSVSCTGESVTGVAKTEHGA